MNKYYHNGYKDSPVLRAYRQREDVKEKKRIDSRRYYEEHKEQCKATSRRISKNLTKEQRAKKAIYNKEYKKTDKYIESQIKYRKTEGGKETAKRSCHNYSKSEKGRLSSATRHNRRRAAKKMVENNFTLEMWKQTLEEYNYLCAYCGSKENIQQDHVVPVSKGGGNTKDNVVPACPSCNASKHNKTLILWMAERV